MRSGNKWWESAGIPKRDGIITNSVDLDEIDLISS